MTPPHLSLDLDELKRMILDLEIRLLLVKICILIHFPFILLSLDPLILLGLVDLALNLVFVVF